MDYLQLQAKTLFNLPYRTNAIILLLLSDSSVSYEMTKIFMLSYYRLIEPNENVSDVSYYVPETTHL